jgi:hypothetical protein
MQGLRYAAIFSVASVIVGVGLFLKEQDKFILNI